MLVSGVEDWALVVLQFSDARARAHTHTHIPLWVIKVGAFYQLRSALLSNMSKNIVQSCKARENANFQHADKRDEMNLFK